MRENGGKMCCLLRANDIRHFDGLVEHVTVEEQHRCQHCPTCPAQSEIPLPKVWPAKELPSNHSPYFMSLSLNFSPSTHTTFQAALSRAALLLVPNTASKAIVCPVFACLTPFLHLQYSQLLVDSWFSAGTLLIGRALISKSPMYTPLRAA